MSQAASDTKPDLAAPTKPVPRKEHQWLQKLIGDWTYEADAPSGSGQPSHKLVGTERVRPLGDVWILAEGEGEMPGGISATTLMTLGYDPDKKGFVGTWIGSMMTYMWTYDGELDADRNLLTLNSDGPAMSGEGTGHYRDVIELRSDDHRVLTAYVQEPDGTWRSFMTTEYRRRKPRA